MGTVSVCTSLSSLLAYISIFTTTRRLVSENADHFFSPLNTEVSSHPQLSGDELDCAARLQGLPAEPSSSRLTGSATWAISSCRKGG